MWITGVSALAVDPKLSGVPIGSPGSFNNDPSVTFDQALDGSTSTYFDSASPGNGAWAGLDLGSGVTKLVSSVRYYPRTGWSQRMVGGKFQGSNNADFSSGVDLFTISSEPQQGAFTSQAVSVPGGFRYVRYLSPDGAFGNIAEVEFYGHDAAPGPNAPASPSALTATGSLPTRVILGWADNSNVESGFKIERKMGAGGVYSQVGIATADVISYQDDAVSEGTLYSYRIRATNSGGDSGYSNEVSVTTHSSDVSPTGTGLKGEYFPNQELIGSPTLVQTDATVNFSWGGSPGGDLPIDQFSVRWTGQVQPQFTETYTFHTNTDDGTRLWVNGVQLVNDWVGHSPQEHSGSIALTAGVKYDIVMEFFDSGGGAVSQLSWSSASTPKAIVPQIRLYPAAGAPAAGTGAFYQLMAKYWDGYGGNYASTYVYVAAPGGPANNAPVISSITASPSTVAAGGTVNLSAIASDADGDSLQYFWVVPAGAIGWSKAVNDTWIAPTVGGDYYLQLMAGDGKTWVSRDVKVTVTGVGNPGPPGVGDHIASITSVKASKTTVAPGESITVTVTQIDPEGDGGHLFNYVWAASGGTINTAELSTNTNTWTAPSSIGSPRGRLVKPGFILWPRFAPDQESCPFPLSTAITGIGLTGRCSRNHISDTWMPCWSADNTLFSAWQDGGLITPPFNTLPANQPDSDKNGWAILQGNDPMDLLLTKAGITDRVAGDQFTNCYPGLVFSKDGVLYYGLRNYYNYDNNGNKTKFATHARLAGRPYLGFNVSTDNGATWTLCPHNEANPLFNEPDPAHCKFSQPYLVDFGKNQQYSPDGKVYFVSNGSLSTDPYVDPLNDDSVFLGRVTPSPSTINNISAYEFYAGNGTWSNSIANAQPIATWADHFNGATVVYNPGLNKFLMTCYKGHYSTPTPTTIHLEEDDTFVLESSSLTGPWNMAMYWTSFGAQCYYPNISSKFISPDGRTAWLFYGANFELGVLPEDPPGSGYRLTEQQLRFLTPQDILSPTAGTLQFTTATTAVVKGTATASVQVSRTGGADGAASIHYATTSGTASSGVNYTSANGVLSWEDGDAEDKTIQIALLNPSAIGASKSFTVNLSSPSGALQGAVGSLAVTINEPPFQAWLYSKIGELANDPTKGGGLGDADGDGISNVMEYALGGNALLSSRASLPVSARETVDGVDSLTLTYRRDTSLSDVTYLVQVSTDLNGWTPVSDVLVSTAGTAQTRKASVPIAGLPKFLRLQVTRN